MMNIESIVLRNLKRLKTKNKSDWNHVKYHHDSYLCPNNFYNKDTLGFRVLGGGWISS